MTYTLCQKTFSRRLLRPLAVVTLSAGLLCSAAFPVAPAYASQDQYSVSLQNAEISEFINTVSASLNKTIIIEPGIRGNITVRSYETLNAEQYYQFFLNVLQVHGFAVTEQDNDVLKVVKSTEARSSAIKLADAENPGSGDEVVTWVLPLKNVSVREMSPLLRQLNDAAGNIVHYDPSNVLLLTGRAANIERLVEIAHRIDQAGGQSTEIISLRHGSATDMARILTTLDQERTSGDSRAVRHSYCG